MTIKLLPYPFIGIFCSDYLSWVLRRCFTSHPGKVSPCLPVPNHPGVLLHCGSDIKPVKRPLNYHLWRVEFDPPSIARQRSAQMRFILWDGAYLCTG